MAENLFAKIYYNMNSFILTIFWCLILFLCGEICKAQRVVNVVTSRYPDNVLPVPVYQGSGNITVELSESAQTNAVEVTCRTLSVDVGVTNVTFQNVIIPVTERSRPVLFNIISAGHVTEVQCTAQSINGGTQFQTASSAGQIGYLQVTRRPTVSLCSDIVVVPMDPAIVRNVEVLFSESVINDPVILNCSIISSLRPDSIPMRLTFNVTSVPLSTRRVNVSYVLESEGDPVIVGCWASSNTSSTTVAQYTMNTSQGDTAVFTYQVPQATFVPASITSLGRTTLTRTVSYLVLESPATEVTEFYCTFHNTSQPSVCVGSLSITSSLDLNSVTVELVTTNMTYEIGEYYKSLEIKVNGSSTQRDQRLLGVTCCRKDPKYFVLATTLSLWIDVYPSVPFDWENITENSQATTFLQFESLCPCDLKVALCDVGCCCDQDCSSLEKEAFPCIPGYFGGSTQSAIFEYGCQETWNDGDNYLAMLCVVTDNNPFLGLLYGTPPASAGDSVQFDSLLAGAPEYEYRENESRSLVEDDVTVSGYRDGVIIKTDRAILTLPQGIGTSACARYAPVVFLRNSVTWCSSEFLESMCSEKSSWSALDYLVPSSTRSCLSSPHVLNLNSRTNSSSVPTLVEYFCVKDSTTYTTEFGKDWGPALRGGSLFNTRSGDESLDFRCLYDDGVSKPPAPEFNASSRICSNVVLKVDYDVYWKEGKIVQLRAKVTLGDISAPAGNLIVAQRFSVKFTYLNEVDPTKLPFIQPALEERSGNPGYIIGKKVIAKIDTGQSGISSVTVNQTSSGHLSLWSSSVTGLCADARTSDILFGVNSVTGCLLKLTLKDFANCSLLRETVLEHQGNLLRATHVARRGNVTLNEINDWVLLLSDISVQSSTDNINSTTSSVTFNQSQGTCENIPSSLHYELLTRKTGTYFGIPQIEIIGARVRYSMHSWTFQCINGNCCNFSNADITGNNYTTQCTERVQSFAVTSSVDFITLSSQNATRIKRSKDMSHICYQDSCAEEVFYPLMTLYDGESREVAIAYGLILVVFVLLLTSVSTPLLENLKTLMIG